MSLHPTPAILAASYELLRTTPPFKRWKLPHADEVEFHARPLRGAVARYYYWPLNDPEKTKQIICVCTKTHSTLSEVLESVAHEMVHIRQRTSGQIRGRTASHGRYFKRLAAQVCRHHGFDEATF